jgi:O-antigen ligase
MNDAEVKAAGESSRDGLMTVLLGGALFCFLIQGSSRIGGEVGPFAVTSVLIVFTAAISIAGLSVGQTQAEKFRGPAVWVKWPFAALISYLFLRQLVAGVPALADLLPLTVFASVAFVANRLAQRRPASLFTVMAAVAVAHVCIAFVEAVLGHTLFYGSWKLADAQYIGGFVRVASTTADPNYFALTLALLAPFCWERVKTWPTPMVILLAAAYSIALMLTFSRSLYVGIAIAILVAALHRRSHKRLVLAVFLSGTAVVLMAVLLPRVVSTVIARFTSTFAGGRDASATTRTLTQEYAWHLSQDQPLFGHGYGTASALLHSFANALVPLNAVGNPAFLPQTSVLNTYLLMFLEGGVIALVLVAAILGAVFGIVRSRGLFQAAWIVGLVMFLFLDVPSFGPVWAFVGAVYGLSVRGFFNVDPTSRTRIEPETRRGITS